ncbi:MAG: NAD-binding protein [Actinomycetota bacterium]|nr:NAD-binding protein [Actinomycetota bacterium]
MKFLRFTLNRAFDDGFARGLTCKDLRIALETTAEREFPMPIGFTLAQVWQAALVQGYGAEGHTTLYAFLEKLVGNYDNK